MTYMLPFFAGLIIFAFVGVVLLGVLWIATFMWRVFHGG